MTFQAVALHLCCVMLVCALALLGSVVVTPSANVTLSALLVGGMLLFGPRLYELSLMRSGMAGGCLRALHWVLPHFELFDMRQRLIHGWEPLGTWVFLAVLGYGLAYALALTGLAAWVFSRKRI